MAGSEDSALVAESVLIPREEYALGNFTRQQEPAPEVNGFRTAQSIIEPITSFRGIWKHSNQQIVAIDSTTNFLLGLKYLPS